MRGLDCLGKIEIGVDASDVAKMFGGLLSGTGGILSGGKKSADGHGDDSKAAAAERQRLEEEKRKAEQSAATMQKVAIGVGAAAVAGGLYLLKVRK
jgi:hypothetical protein